MASMPGNPHEAAANSSRNYPEERVARAILALAYEQHTANLIALEQMENDRHVHGGWAASPYGEIIRQRMDTRSYRAKGGDI